MCTYVHFNTKLCSSCPNGQVSALSIVVSTIATILSILSVVSCTFYEVNGERYGFWYWQSRYPIYDNRQTLVGYQDYCKPYTENKFYDDDDLFSVSRAFNMLSLLIGGLSCIYLWLGSCFVMRDCAICCTSTCFLFSSVFQTLGFLIFLGRNCKELPSSSCSVDHGARVSIAASVFWFLSAILVPCIPDVVSDDDISRRSHQHQTHDHDSYNVNVNEPRYK